MHGITLFIYILLGLFLFCSTLWFWDFIIVNIIIWGTSLFTTMWWFHYMNILHFMHFTIVGHLGFLWLFATKKMLLWIFLCLLLGRYMQKVPWVIYPELEFLGLWVCTLSPLPRGGKKDFFFVTSCTLS